MSVSYQSLLGVSDISADTLVTESIVAGTIETKELQVDNDFALVNGAGADKVLTCVDSSGLAQWSDPDTNVLMVGDCSGQSDANVVNSLGGGTLAVSDVQTAVAEVEAATSAGIVDTLVRREALVNRATLDIIGNATTAGSVTMAGEVSGNSGSCVLDNDSVISKTLSGYVSGSGVVAEADSILQAIQKLNGNTTAATGVSTATPDTVARRNASAGCAFADLVTANITATGMMTGPNITLTGANAVLQAPNSQALTAYCGGNGNYFNDALTGDSIYRNTVGSLRFGTNATASQLQVKTTGVNVTGDLSASGTVSCTGRLDMNSQVNQNVISLKGGSASNEFIGFGSSASRLRLQVAHIADAFEFHAATSAIASNLVASLTGLGNLTLSGTCKATSFSGTMYPIRHVALKNSYTATVQESGMWFNLNSGFVLSLPDPLLEDPTGCWYTISSVGTGLHEIRAVNSTIVGRAFGGGYRNNASWFKNTGSLQKYAITVTYDGSNWVVSNGDNWGS